ncbi:MAG: hypothetical protein ACRDN1_11000 [Trebonia sp.]
MTLRARVTQRIRYTASLRRFIAFLDAHPDLPMGDTMEGTFTVGPGTFGERKAAADSIAAALEATTKWRNGYYMAERRTGQFVREFHFVPVIMRPDAGGDTDAVYPQAS